MLMSNIFNRDEANLSVSAFYLRYEKDDQKVILEDKDLEVLGTPIIKYGDSTVIVQHVESSLWLSYKVSVSCQLFEFDRNPFVVFNRIKLKEKSNELLCCRRTRRRRRAWAKWRRNRPSSTKRVKWTTVSSSAAVKKKSRGRPESSANATLFSVDSSGSHLLHPSPSYKRKCYRNQFNLCPPTTGINPNKWNLISMIIK